MKPLTCCMCAIVLLAASAAAYADAKSDAAARAKAVAPFVEAETAIVAHVDLTRVYPSAAVDFAARTTYPTPPPNEIAEAKKEATKGLQGAIQAGVKEFYVVVTLDNQGWMPKMLAVVPMPAAADVASFREALHLPAGAGRVADGSLVFHFPDNRWQPVDKFQPVARPELVTAFETAGDSAVQVAIIPPAYAPRVIEELLPQFPK